MKINKGSLVTRKSYNHDIIFKVINISNHVYYLKGIDIRLFADSPLKDLVLVEHKPVKDEFYKNTKRDLLQDRSDYFFLPAKILHIDGDEDYLNRCLEFYKDIKIQAVGKSVNESDIPYIIENLIKTYMPDIVIITGHDAIYNRKGIETYKNSNNFIKAVKIARKIEKSHEKLVIIAGACQSNYEELIKAGANFASSPKRINIHALDPAIIASTIALTERNKEIDLIKLLNKTKYGKDGIGGLKCNGLMYVGFPR